MIGHLATVLVSDWSMVRTVDPCHDFFEFACGTWNKRHVIPEDRSVVSCKQWNTIQYHHLYLLKLSPMVWLKPAINDK